MKDWIFFIFSTAWLIAAIFVIFSILGAFYAMYDRVKDIHTWMKEDRKNKGETKQ